MKDYQFQYTKIGDTLLVLLFCFIIFFVVAFIGFYLKVQEFLLIIIELIIMFFSFKLLKKKAVKECIAKINDTSVDFNFQEKTRTINFNELISFKAYYGKNGPVLYLNNNVDNFKIAANNNFCKTDDFQTFCEDLIVKLDKYKAADNPKIIHEGSIFATKGMLYFLIIATLVYLLAFIIENKETRLPIGLGGGIYLLLSWTIYFNRRNLKSK